LNSTTTQQYDKHLQKISKAAGDTGHLQLFIHIRLHEKYIFAISQLLQFVTSVPVIAGPWQESLFLPRPAGIYLGQKTLVHVLSPIP